MKMVEVVDRKCLNKNLLKRIIDNNLIVLNLKSNFITSKNIKDFAKALKFNNTLTIFNLKNTNITCIEALAKMLKINRTLSILNLSKHIDFYIKNTNINNIRSLLLE